jgi:Arc/MetJ-type ribon-helix-helix transcriptional regulator
MATETETLTVTLPVELMEFIRERVASGKFSSENDAMADAIREVKEYSWLPDEPIGMSDEEWEVELQRRISQFERGETRLRSLEEVKQDFASLRQERMTA